MFQQCQQKKTAIFVCSNKLEGQVVGHILQVVIQVSVRKEF